jgi:putative SOS response-associated peptidase YedK
MCGRYTLTTGRPQLEKRFGELASLPEDRIFSERFNIAPSQEIARRK